MISNSTIYIVRHGETDYNINHITQGHTDSHLTENGINQAQKIAQIFKDIKFDIVFSSDLSRAQRTAEIITEDRGLTVNTSKLLRERSYGQYDGRPSSIFVGENREILDSLKTLPRLERRKIKFAPDIESDEEINNRMLTFLKELGREHSDKTILITTHGGIMRAFLNHLNWNGEEDLRSGAVKNTGYIKLRANGDDFTIEKAVGVEK